MKEYKSGLYHIGLDGTLELLDYMEIPLGTILLKSKDFNKVDIDLFPDQMIWINNTPMNLDIEIFSLPYNLYIDDYHIKDCLD